MNEHLRILLPLILLGIAATSLEAEEPPVATKDGTTQAGKDAPATSTAEKDAIAEGIFIKDIDYSGDLWTRPALTGDWGGLRSRLIQKGWKLSFSFDQTVQGNISGGRRRQLTYHGALDYSIELDTGKAGLWPGGYIKVKGETTFGLSDNGNTGALLPVNADALYPIHDEVRGS